MKKRKIKTCLVKYLIDEMMGNTIGRASNVKNEFLLRITSNNIEKLDNVFRNLISQKEFDAVLLTPNLFKEENKAIYRVRISPASLIELKKRIDCLIAYRSFKLFEFKEW
jgi:hypothetical protein